MASGITAPSRGMATETLKLNADGSLVMLEPGCWFVCFVPGIEKQWWHPFAHKLHKHVFALRPEQADQWTVFEPWWTRIVVATITSEQARKFLRWGTEGDILLVRESIPGHSSQFRGCSPGAPRPPGAAKPICMGCGRDLERPAWPHG